MMNVSQKCQYALRAVLELARRQGRGPTRISHIAKAQAIPAKFLESILAELKQGGFVESQRGARGGYLLARPAQDQPVGPIIRFVEGPLTPVKWPTEPSDAAEGQAYGSRAMLDMWTRGADAMAQVYDNTTFQDLLDEEVAAAEQRGVTYCI